MRARLAQAAPLLFLLMALVVSPSVFAQIPPCLERKLPIPSLGNEINQRKADPPKQMVSIESVTFEGEFDWPEAIRDQITKALKLRQFDASKDWVADLENQARGVLQDRGYFKANPRAKVKVLLDDPLQPRVSVTLRDNHLEKYRLHEIRIVHSADDDPKLVFPREKLRALFPMRSGDIFSVQKIREGLEGLRKLYGSKGYIDETATPVTTIDEAYQRILLTVEVDEEKQFIIDKVEIHGLNPALEKSLRKRVIVGTPFNHDRVKDFYRENKSALPAGAKVSNLRIDRDLKAATLKLFFDFRPCPPIAPPPAAGHF